MWVPYLPGPDQRLSERSEHRSPKDFQGAVPLLPTGSNAETNFTPSGTGTLRGLELFMSDDFQAFTTSLPGRHGDSVQGRQRREGKRCTSDCHRTPGASVTAAHAQLLSLPVVLRATPVTRESTAPEGRKVKPEQREPRECE